VPVSNLAAGAAAALRLHGWRRVLVAFDARMDEMYAGAFETGADGMPRLLGAERLLAPAALALPAGAVSAGNDGWHGAGSAFAAWPQLVGQLDLVAADAQIAPLARDLLGLAAAALARGDAVAAEDALPVYLREQVAWRNG
jgi:tRNA threonylcarbamoyladenosine biosynthesis protein TsaB